MRVMHLRLATSSCGCGSTRARAQFRTNITTSGVCVHVWRALCEMRRRPTTRQTHTHTAATPSVLLHVTYNVRSDASYCTRNKRSTARCKLTLSPKQCAGIFHRSPLLLLFAVCFGQMCANYAPRAFFVGLKWSCKLPFACVRGTRAKPCSLRPCVLHCAGRTVLNKERSVGRSSCPT